MATAFRLVRCPNCRRVLPEVPNVPVYKCGGCGALLQAKIRKTDEKTAEQSNSELMNEPNHVSEYKTNTPSGCSQAEDQNRFVDRKGKKPEVACSSSSNDNNKTGGTHFGSEDCDMEGPRIESDVYSSTELAHNDTKEPLPSAKAQERCSSALAQVFDPNEKTNETGLQGIDSMRSRVTVYGSPNSELSGFFMDESKYDGSISSSDELEHRIPNRFAHSLKNNRHGEIDEYDLSREKYRNEQFSEHRQRTRHPHRNHLPPKVPLTRGRFSREYDSILHSPSDMVYQNQEKIELLRVIRDLQGQLDKSCSLEENIPTCYIQETRMGNTWNDRNYHMHSRNMIGSNSISSQHQEFSRMYSSGEAPDCQCPHCHPRDWKQHSAPLPQSIYHRYDSYQSRPPHYSESEYSVSGDQRLSDQVQRKYQHVDSKKHFRPKAGGSPFITCYKCGKLLQLPEDFLIFKKQCHKLKCGSCATILKFSVQNRTHIVPYSSSVVDLAPIPSEADEHSAVMNRNNNISYIDPVSYSDDFGLDQGSLEDDSSRGSKMAHASSSRAAGKRREFVRNRFSNRQRDPMAAYGSRSGERAEKDLSEMEAQRQQRSNSPLHRLMGYSSPSMVMRGNGDVW